VPLLAAMLSLPLDGQYRPVTLSPEKQRAKTIEALGDQLVGLARRQPVFVTFEDAHWADPTSVDVLTHIVPRIADHRVLVVITCRPEFVPPWSVGAYVTSLSLQSLSRAEVTVFIGRVAGETPLPRAIVAEIVSKTDGVPLYIEELTKSMLESGLGGAEASASGSVPSAAIPATLQDALMARLDRLAPVRESRRSARLSDGTSPTRCWPQLLGSPPTSWKPDSTGSCKPICSSGMAIPQTRIIGSSMP